MTRHSISADDLEASGKAPWQGPQPIEDHAKMWKGRLWVPLEAAIADVQFWQRRDYEHGTTYALADQRDERGGEFQASVPNTPTRDMWAAGMLALVRDPRPNMTTREAIAVAWPAMVAATPADTRGGESAPSAGDVGAVLAWAVTGQSVYGTGFLRPVIERLARAALASPATPGGVGEWVLIWSGEHHAYWRSNSAGYTIDGLAAGVYDREAAERIVAGISAEKKVSLRPINPSWPIVAALLAARPPLSGDRT